VSPRVLVIVLAVAAILLQTGAGEAVENIVHWAAHGHAAHDAAHAESQQGDVHSDLEHGCAGHFHVCPCCAHPVMASAMLGLAVPAAPECSEQLAPASTRAGPEGADTLLFRPPIAG